MAAIVAWVLTTFTSPLGIMVLSALDSTIFFSLPFGIDGAVIVFAARSENAAWVVPALATIGSTAGALLTYWMGAKVGEKGIDKLLSPRRLNQLRTRARTGGAVAIALLDLLPPPFPFSVFMLAAGALKVRPSVLFAILTAGRIVRFGVEAWLTARYGRPLLLRWFDSRMFHDLIGVCFVLAIVLSAVSIFRLVRTMQRPMEQATA